MYLGGVLAQKLPCLRPGFYINCHRDQDEILNISYIDALSQPDPDLDVQKSSLDLELQTNLQALRDW